MVGITNHFTWLSQPLHYAAPVPDRAQLDDVVQRSFDVIARLTKVAAAHGLSLSQLRLLGILRDHEPTMTELADHLGQDKSSITGLVRRAEAKGWVERTTDDTDKRSTRVRLTTQGRRQGRVLEEAAYAALESVPP
jgi:DNA-binding MarR family transcriptional regulator